jgi:hypothetical protein
MQQTLYSEPQPTTAVYEIWVVKIFCCVYFSFLVIVRRSNCRHMRVQAQIKGARKKENRIQTEWVRKWKNRNAKIGSLSAYPKSFRVASFKCRF